MWFFLGRGSGRMDRPVADPECAAQTEAQKWREQAEDLQAKLDALRAADDRELQRASCAQMADGESASAAVGLDPDSACPPCEPQRFVLFDDGNPEDRQAGESQIENMFDFSSFLPAQTTPKNFPMLDPVAGSGPLLRAIASKDEATMTELTPLQSVHWGNAEKALAKARSNVAQVQWDLQVDASKFAPVFTALDAVQKDMLRAQQHVEQMSFKQMANEAGHDPSEGCTQEHVLEFAHVTQDTTDPASALQFALQQYATLRNSIEPRLKELETAVKASTVDRRKNAQLEDLVKDLEGQRDAMLKQLVETQRRPQHELHSTPTSGSSNTNALGSTAATLGTDVGHVIKDLTSRLEASRDSERKARQELEKTRRQLVEWRTSIEPRLRALEAATKTSSVRP